MSRLRSTSLLALALVLTAVPTTRAQMAHLSFRAADEVLTGVRQVAQLAGQDELVKQIDGMQLLAGPDDIAGVDRKKPFGLYLVPANDPPVCVAAFFPIVEEKKFLTALKLLGVQVGEDLKGERELTTAESVKLTLRFAHGHAHLAPAATPLPERLPDPARFLPAGHRDLIMGDLKLDRIQRDLSGSLEALADLLLRAVAGERGPKEGFQVRVNHGKKMDLDLHLDPKHSRLGLDLTVKPTQGKLARWAGLAARLAGKAEIDLSLGDRGTLRLRLRTGNEGN